MSLKDKLARLPYLSAQRAVGSARVSSSDEHAIHSPSSAKLPLTSSSSSSSSAAAEEEAATVDASLSRMLPGECRMGHGGMVQVVQRSFGLEETHGHVALARAFAASPISMARVAFDPIFEQIDLRGMLLLDTETTGLMGGTGTLPIVIGMAWFDQDDHRLQMQQYVLPGPGQETPMLHAVRARLAAASCLVTFNGKTFDWPLLRNRFVLNRIEPFPIRMGKAHPSETVGLPHLDILHCARRVFKRRLGGVRLTALEQDVLGFHRINDVPGDQIPELYFAYLREKDGSTLRPVVEHNAYDLLALAALVGVISERMQSVDARDPREDTLSVARCWAHHKDIERTAQWVQSMPDDVEALWLMAQTYQSHAHYHQAVAVLERAVELTMGSEKDLWRGRMHLALAKWYEHRLDDPQRALEHAQHVTVQQAEGMALHTKRLERLHQRIRRRAAKST